MVIGALHPGCALCTVHCTWSSGAFQCYLEQVEQILGQKRTFLSSTLPCVYFKGKLADSDLKRYCNTLSHHVHEPQLEDLLYYVTPQPQSSVTHIEKVQDSGDGRFKINFLRNALLPSQ